MKRILSVLLLSLSLHSFAFTECHSNEMTRRGLPVLSVNLYHTDKVQALVTHRLESMLPQSYLCDVQALEENRHKLKQYSCLGGGMNEDKNVIITVDETALEANYFDTENEDNDVEGLECEITLKDPQ